MKTISVLLVFLILTGLSFCSYAQYQHTPVKLTFGNDRNPSFQIRYDGGYDLTNFPFEFLTYERVNGSAVNICVSKINTSGALDSGLYLTNNTFLNINPAIGFYKSNSYISEILNSLVVWETDKNGNKDIYARIYKQNQGWFNEFSVDSSGGDQTNPQVAMINQYSYAVVYKSGNDIKLKIINTDNQSILKDTNLTSGINEICKNPFVIVSTGTPKKMYISYEREFSSTHNSIYCLKADTIAGTLNLFIDTVKYSGLNRNAGFVQMGSYPNPYMCVYENYSNGKRNVFGTEIKWNGQSSVHHNILTSTVYDMWSYKGSDFMIGDNTLNGCYGFLTKINNSVYVKTKMEYSWDSVNVLVSNDTNYYSKIALSTTNVVPSSACFRMWYAFEKNLGANDRGIFGISFTTCAMNIRKINSIATDFSLSQNYPNPFNPTTKIKFSLPQVRHLFGGSSPRGLGGDLVILKVFDITGHEVQTLVNETLQPGTYETTFDGGNLTSGVYFYQLVSGNYKRTKRMILLK